MDRLKRLLQHRSIGRDFGHDAPDLEATLPADVAGRSLERWSVAGESFWRAAGGDRVKSALAPELEGVGVSPAAIEMAVAGRSDSSHPPYIIWALRFGDLTGPALEGPVPSALAMDMMSIDVTQGENWRDTGIAGRRVLVGDRAMVRQDRHHQGLPYVYLTSTTIYALIADDAAWAEEVIGALPAT